MHIIYFVTSNKGKVASAQAILKNLSAPFAVEILAEEYPEDKSVETTAAIAQKGAEWCATRFKKPVLVTDAGLYIDALNGFPGVNTGFTLKHIGNQGLLRLLAGEASRQAKWILSLGFARPGESAQVHTHTSHGMIAQEETGEGGFGFDPIFIPAEHTQTLAQDTALRDRISPFRFTLEEFVRSYESE